MTMSTKGVSSSNQVTWSQDVSFLNAKELKTAAALVQAEVKKQPKMRSAGTSKAGGDAPIVCRYLFPPTIKYLKPPTNDMWNIMAATVNSVLDGKKITKDEVSLMKKVFNKVIEDNPNDKKAIQTFLFKVQTNVRKTAPKTEDGVFKPLYAKDGPMYGFNEKHHVYAILPPPVAKPSGHVYYILPPKT